MDGNIQRGFDIGYINDKADLVKYNPHKVAYYFDKACIGGNTIACYNVGVLYSEGSYGKNGLKADIEKSRKAYTIGCNLGDLESCGALKFLDEQSN
jgi:TPR repeat protein